VNDGNGNFSDSGQRLGAGRGYGMATGDINGDGHIDVYVGSSASFGSPSTVWFNDGVGFFRDGDENVAYGRVAALSDLNGDGDLDLFLAKGSANRILFNSDPGVTVSPKSGLETGEDGTTDTFDVVLHAEPSNPVTIDLSSSDQDEGVLAGATGNQLTLSFDASNWDIPQTVTVIGVDDAAEDGDIDYEIVTSSIVSLDAGYHGIDPPDVSVANIDDEEQSVSAFNLYVYDIRFESRRGGKDWRAVVEIRPDSNLNGTGDAGDNPVAGVTIQVTFAGHTYSGVTDSSGVLRTAWHRKLGSGTHYANVVDLALTGYEWDSFLDREDDTDGNGLPDDVLVC